MTPFVVVLTDSTMLLISADRHRRLDDRDVFETCVPDSSAPNGTRWQETAALPSDDVARVEVLSLRRSDFDDDYGCG